MGIFLSLSGVIGRTQNEVVTSLTDYAKSVGGGLELDNLLSPNDDNCCVIEETNGNTTIFNPYGYLEWDKSSEFISKELKAPVFSCHIHDGDLWMYVLYKDGEIVDQFNPIPDYWDDNMSEEEIESWQGNASTIANLIPSLKITEIEKYLVRWDLETEEIGKAYAEDEFTNEDWQILDFLKKLGLPYPLDENGNAKGQVYKLWTREFRLPQKANNSSPVRPIVKELNKNEKPWWKLW